MSGGGSGERRDRGASGRNNSSPAAGGGGYNDENEAEQPNLQDYVNAPIARAFQPSLPNGLDMLSSQLQSGFGSGGGDMGSFLSNLYKPMNILQLLEPISTTASQFDKTKHNPLATGNPELDRLLMGAANANKNRNGPGDDD